MIFIAKPIEFLGCEIKLISLKNAYIHVLIMVIIFIDDIDDVDYYYDTKSHVNMIATRAAHMNNYKMIERIVRKLTLLL